ncbi:porin [Nitratireductor rhodophyticola]|uniref:porin n=1 Tax=Nitratireductor rhodophyticola TaxID=2854036 RepID=UPI00081416D9|nr:porin [Nitratireductor rhodophyticola]WPZ14082.1 porin [Nitratireductor rhodophyticola]
MKLKSLLIGSAALAAAATGAKAADPIVVPEPEPMEYVRVCDVYGAGFFYIPGTETCLKISGMVRYQIGYSDGDFGDSEGWDKYARGELNIDARSETEYGTLGAWIKLRGTSGNDSAYTVNAGDPDFDLAPGLNDGDAYSHGVTSSGVNLQQAVISLGGLSMGMSDSIWDTGLHGEQDRGFFPYSRVHFIGYNFAAGNGVTFAVMLEEADDNYDWTPNVVGKVGIAQGWGSADLYAAYDATAEEFAIKGIVKANLTDRFFIQGLAQYESGVSFYSANPFDGIATVTYGGVAVMPGAEWSLAGVIGFKATPKLTASIGAAYYSEVGHNVVFTDTDAWNVGTTIDYEIVENFNAKLAVNYTQFDTPAGDADQFHGFLRFQRDF